MWFGIYQNSLTILCKFKIKLFSWIIVDHAKIKCIEGFWNETKTVVFGNKRNPFNAWNHTLTKESNFISLLYFCTTEEH